MVVLAFLAALVAVVMSGTTEDTMTDSVTATESPFEDNGSSAVVYSSVALLLSAVFALLF